ncbi:MAG TPA: ABC transporter permease, partial [Chloroflexota bacterium]|nr:ABC transporter permease [Chloroflexota bacterium]
MIAYLQQHQGYVWQLTLLHLALCGEALGIALLIALPLGILISRYHALYVPIIGSFGAIYTIPSLALFALLVPQFGLTQVTALIALVVYAQFILIRNVATGLRGVDRAVIEAAAGMGMSPAQVLWKVELPLALPVIVAGLRIATVTVIAVATIATYISVHELGDILSEGVSKGDNGEIEAG